MPLDEQLPGSLKILDTIDQGVAVFDKHLRLMYINPAMKGVTGGKNALGWSLRDMIDKHQLFDESGKAVSIDKFPIVMAFSGKDTIDQRFEYVDSAGHHTWLSVSCRRILDKRGQLEYVFTTIRDISRRKSNESKLQFLLESAKILNLMTDFRSRLKEKAKLTVPELADWCAIDLLSNGDIERVVEIHRDPRVLAELHASEMLFPPNPDSPANSKNVINSQKPLYIPLLSQHMVHTLAGSEGRADMLRRMQLKSLMVIPIAVRGKGLGAMMLAYTSSGRMYTQDDFEFFQEFCYHLGAVFESSHFLEEVERRDNAKDIFIATLSHELRNPLSPIKSALELVRLQNPPAHIADELQVIEHNVDHLAKLLNDLLDVTRFTKGLITIDAQMLDVRHALSRAVKTMQHLASESGIDLKHIPSDAALVVQGDETRLEQAIMNLLSNAIKFTPRGGTIWASTAIRDSEAHIVIRDTGIGIANKDLGRIFDMFYQAERSKRVSGGLGIGLLLVDSIARLHGGSVSAKSKGTGKGSEFTLRLPLAKEAVPPLSASTPAPAVSSV